VQQAQTQLLLDLRVLLELRVPLVQQVLRELQEPLVLLVLLVPRVQLALRVLQVLLGQRVLLELTRLLQDLQERLELQVLQVVRA